MIVFDLDCGLGHRFEGWFGSSADYEQQLASGMLACPHCGDTAIHKAPMAPAVPSKGNQGRDAAMMAGAQRELAKQAQLDKGASDGAGGNSGVAAGSERASPADSASSGDAHRPPNPMSEPDAGQERPLSAGQIPEPVRAAMQALAQAQAEAIKDSKWVGDDLANQSRAMHYGERKLEAIHGKATLEEAKELLEEGVPIAPLLCPVIEPDKLN